MTRKSFLATLLAGPLALLAGVKYWPIRKKDLQALEAWRDDGQWALALYCYIHGCSLQDISLVTRIPVPALKKAIARKGRLHHYLSKDGIRNLTYAGRPFTIPRTPRKFYTAP